MGGGIYRLKEHPAWVKEKARKMISMFWYANALPFNYASSDFYPQMVAFIVEARLGPGAGVTIMTDGWKDKSYRYLVNFLIGCPRGIVYISSIDLSRKRHTGRLICIHLYKIVNEVGPENVVQVVTDNATNYRKACLFIYNHTYLHALMREHCMREIVKESPARFTPAFLTIQSILVNKAGLKRVREAIFENNIWNEAILEIVDRRWRDQLHQDIHTTGFFLNPQNLYSNVTLDYVDIMEGVRNCIYRLEPDIETQMECMQQRNIYAPRRNRLKTQTLYNLVYIYYNLKLREKHTRRTPTDYTPINLDYIFRRDLADEWVSLRTLLIDQDFLSGAATDMDDNVNVAASNEGDMTMDMDDDYTQDEDEAHDDETYETMENNWKEPIIQECEGAQHDAMPDEQEDLMRLAREEVQALKHRSYSTRERRSRGHHRNLVIHDDDNIEDAEGHNTEQCGGNTEVRVTQNRVGESMKAGRV
ncbi:hypothetical protein AMTRI_Chr02g257920 [Amborella trichopoda]